MESYDLIIVGAGPAGLSLAQCMKDSNKKILIIDKEKQVGGCHKVERVKVDDEYIFTEHGPRVYVDNYLTFRDLLDEMGTSFHKLFTSYNFSNQGIMINNVINKLSLVEIMKFAKEFLSICVDDKYGKDIQLKKYLETNNFSSEAIDALNRVCILLDGGDISKYTLNQLLQIFNQSFFYNIYQPRLPNDKGLFKIWYEFLNKHDNIEFRLETTVISIDNDEEGNKSVNVVQQGDIKRTYFGDKIVIATPPLQLVSILERSDDDNVKNAFGEFTKLQQFSNDTMYIDYICITFHWDKKISFPKMFYGFPKSEWGLISIVMSDYMYFEESVSKTLISCAISMADVVSKRINKTANQCSTKELIDEAWFQLQMSYPNIKESPPTLSVLYPGCYYDDKLKVWKNDETAFISTSSSGFIDFESKDVKGLYTLGTHNGTQSLKYTVLETAVSNAVELAKVFDPALKAKYHVREPYTLSFALKIILVILLLIIAFKFFPKS